MFEIGIYKESQKHFTLLCVTAMTSWHTTISKMIIEAERSLLLSYQFENANRLRKEPLKSTRSIDINCKYRYNLYHLHLRRHTSQKAARPNGTES